MAGRLDADLAGWWLGWKPDGGGTETDFLTLGVGMSNCLPLGTGEVWYLADERSGERVRTWRMAAGS